MNTYVFHIDGQEAYSTLKIKAVDETHAVNLLLSVWLDSKPLTTEGKYKLIHIESEAK